MMQKNRAVYWAVTLLIVYLVLEISSFAVYWMMTGKVYSLRNIENQRASLLVARQKHEDAPVFQLSPYGGYIYPRNAVVTNLETFKTDPYGFLETYDPVKPDGKKDFIVAVAGGSFAMQLFVHGKQRLYDYFAHVPALADRHVKIVCLAVGGYAEPGQLFATSYYYLTGRTINLLLNVDGYNEISMIQQSHIPQTWFVFFSLLQNSNNPAIGRIQLLRQLEEEVAAAFEPLRYSISANTLWYICNQLLWQRINARWRQLEVRANVSAPRMFANETNQATHVQVWKTATILLSQMVESQGGKYMEFIQPNQFFHQSKILTGRELALMKRGYQDLSFNDSDRNINTGYAALLAEIPLLQKNNHIALYDFTQIYKDRSDNIYIDGCCHINDTGVALFMDRMLEMVNQAHAVTTDAAVHANVQ